jgi:hypothetical protein
VDQLETSTPGFIGQITGILTRQRIVGSTIFVDQASDLGYVYHHLSMSSEETVKAKESFERYAKSYGVNIKHYHADNGGFKDKAFMKDHQLFRSRSPPSKWDCREEDRRPAKKGHNLTAACTEKMVRRYNHKSMAICSESS